MKALVLRRFRDKNTQGLYKKGAEIELTKERLEEINSTSAGVLVEGIKGAVIKNARGTTKRH